VAGISEGTLKHYGLEDAAHINLSNGSVKIVVGVDVFRDSNK
jgi:hypothetical protein